ncbi:MAG: TRAP transporter small permease [Pseudomonadota bacterium]|nr:TRAP transporter small permease [Pseudomonadota bacterium]
MVISRLTRALDNALMPLAALGLVLMLGHVALEVVLRLLGVVSQLQTITFVSAFYMVAVVFAALPYAEGREGHISVDIFTSMLPEPVQRAMSRVFSAVSALCLGYMAWLSLLQAWEKTERGEIWETSTGYFLVWPGRWAVFLAFTALALHYLLRAIRPQDAPQQSLEGDA